MYGEEAIDVRCMLLGSGGENWRLVKDGGNKQRGGFRLKPLVGRLLFCYVRFKKIDFLTKYRGKTLTSLYIYLFLLVIVFRAVTS